MAFTYDETVLEEGSDAGRLARVRLLIADCVNTADQPAIYSDAEISAFLRLTSRDEYEAGALAVEGIARSRIRLSKYLQRSGMASQRHALAEIMATAQALREAPRRMQLQVVPITSDTAAEYLDVARGEAEVGESPYLTSDGEQFLIEG